MCRVRTKGTINHQAILDFKNFTLHDYTYLYLYLILRYNELFSPLISRSIKTFDISLGR